MRIDSSHILSFIIILSIFLQRNRAFAWIPHSTNYDIISIMREALEPSADDLQLLNTQYGILQDQWRYVPQAAQIRILAALAHYKDELGKDDPDAKAKQRLCKEVNAARGAMQIRLKKAGLL